MVAWQPIAIAEMVEFWSGEQMKCPSRPGAWPPTSIGIAPFSDCAHSDRNEVVCVLLSSIPMPQHVGLEGSVHPQSCFHLCATHPASAFIGLVTGDEIGISFSALWRPVSESP